MTTILVTKRHPIVFGITVLAGTVILSMFFLLASSNVVYSQSQTDKLYENPLFGIKFQYPPEWTDILTEGQGGAGFSLEELVGSPPNVFDRL